ncbi:helix-turn-helix domain-containing protein [Methylocystis sp. ATCC 49242]|uniref:helix-turn-helix domain-containing protein n=1 Tax=Methylocystis sp. ATCC 49242 TaxID=622637 RepID=UPI0001F86CC7|nr:helix-turn-helix domain-containing protein [Methylocystis sp. ATCC 49242]
MNQSPNSIADDLLEGADEISIFLFGEHDDKRRVYHLIARGHLPSFRIGKKIFARKSALLKHLSDLEANGTKGGKAA